MPAPRFYCDIPLAPHARLTLPQAVAHHAVRVLRLRDGDAVVLFDGQGGEYPAILRLEGRDVWAETAAHDPREAELAGTITLVQGLPSGDKMDWIIEKAVELGASRVVPIAAQRSVLQLTGERQARRLTHWRRVATAASEQCGRNRILQVDAPLTLRQWLATAGAAPGLLCHPGAAHDLRGALAARATAPGPARELRLLVGPEGGWTDDELAAAVAHGAQAIRLGSRVLRTETAGLALIAAASALLGWDADPEPQA